MGTGSHAKGVLACRLVDYIAVVGVGASHAAAALAALRGGAKCAMGLAGPALADRMGRADPEGEMHFECLEVLTRFPAADHSDLQFPMRLEWFCYPGEHLTGPMLR